MGRIKHDAIVVTAWSTKYLSPVHEKACELFGPLVSEMVPGAVNGQASFLVAPDGSKEGWDDSDLHDDLREQFKEYLKSENTFVDYVFINFGGDDDACHVYSGQYEEEP